MQCAECGSLMELQDGIWTCNTCFNAVPVVSNDDDTILEDDLMLKDVLRQMEAQ